MTMRRLAVCAAAVSVLTAGCSGNSPDPVSAGAGRTLQADVLTLTRLVATGHWSPADRALSQVRTDLLTAAAAGEVTPEREQLIRADLAAISADLAAHRTRLTPTSTSPSKSPSPTHSAKPSPKPQPAPTKHGHGHHHDHGKGHGHD